MKRIFTLLSFLCLFGTTQAQLADGTVVQDFTFTDIDGNEQSLYDILNQGKSIVIDVFATWCGPCWSYHQAHHLNDVWDNYGPDGTNEMYVIGVEGDGATPVEAIWGAAGTNTIGDWTTGVPYPMVNSSSIANQLAINYYPTLFMICQDRTIREVGQINATSMYAAHNECAQPVGINNAGLSDYLGNSLHFCDDYAFTPKISVTNYGTSIMTTATLEVIVNGSTVSTVDFEGELYTFDKELISFDEITVAPGDEIAINILAVNGEDDEDSSDNLYTEILETPQEIDNNTLNVEIMTDSKGNETFWAILDGTGAVVEDGGNVFVGLNGGGTQGIPFGGYDDNTLYEITVTLPQTDCYKIRLVDNWGDGLTGDGYFKVTDANGNVVYEVSDFEAYANRTVSASFTVGTDEIAGLENFRVYPNPTQSDITINLDLTETIAAQLTLTDLSGKIISTQNLGQRTAGNHQIELSMNDLAPGVYYVELTSDKGVATQKVVKF